MSKLEFDVNWSGIRFGSERHIPDSPVIVLNGHTYHLIVDSYPDVYMVCKRCALEHLCLTGEKECILRRLCKECTPRGAGYWVEDRYPVTYTLDKIMFSQNPESNDLELACKAFDRPMFDHFIIKS